MAAASFSTAMRSPGFGIVLAMILAWTGTCAGDFFCNFDDPGICGFTQDTGDDVDFLHHSGRTPTAGTGPSGDHTSGSAHYMYLESSGVPYGTAARLISPRFNGTVNHDDDASNGVVVTFWVFMHGEEVGTLRVLTMNATDDNSTRDRVLMREETSVVREQGGQWVQKNVTVTRSSEDFHIVFEAEVGSSSLGDIAFDDVTVEDTIIPTPVPTEPPALQEFNCTFDTPLSTDICVFSQELSPNDDFNVVKRSSPHPNAPYRNWYAPGKDHTLGNITGKYLSVYAYNRYGYYYYYRSNRQRAGDKARIITPMLVGVAAGEEPACLLFWYHMHGGTNVGEINVYVKNETSATLGDPVWRLSGERGSAWRAAEVRIEQPIKFQIVFEFVAGYLEDMSIDDVSLSRYQCPGEHPVALEPTVDCDFDEAEICYYTHDETSVARWIWSNRATDSSFTGPSQDHTRGDELGFYLHIDSAHQQPMKKARVMTPAIDAQSSVSCFQFWYHMYGSHIGHLNVYAKYANESLPETPSWTRNSNQGNQWHRGLVNVPEMTREFVMVFEGVLGSDYRTDIAIDDVQYSTNGPCPEYTTPEPIATTLPTGIQSDLSCDFESDEGSGDSDDEDEAMCGFTQAVDDIKDWRRATGGTVFSEIFSYYSSSYYYYRYRYYPEIVDHTLNTPQGSFLGVWYRSNSALRRSDTARVLSPLLSGAENTRCFEFYLYRSGSYNAFINVYIQEYGATRSIDPQFTQYWNTYGKWYRRQVEIPPSMRPFYIVFEAVIPSKSAYRMVYGIDDISLKEGRCDRKQEYSGSCDFEDGMCGYTASSLFIRNSGKTPSKNTGPSVDHTLANEKGHYMYLESSQPVIPGQVGALTSPTLHFMGKQCIRFYVHASGNDTRRLTVSLYESAKQKYTSLAKIEGKQPNAWMPVNVDVDVAGDYRVYFNAYSGRSYESDIAIDDITILPTPCDNHPSELTCLFELGPESCGFEHTRENGDDGWQWYDAIFGRHYPLSSRSTESNSFMYLRSSNSSNRQSSELFASSLTVDPTKTKLCLSFEYVIDGNSTQTIDVSLEEKSGKRRALASVTDAKMSEWKMMTMSLLKSHYLRPFTVYRIIFSVPSPTNQAVVGIDNVIISADACSLISNDDGGGYGEGPEARTSSRRNRDAMAVTVTIVIIVVVAIGIACFAYRGRLKSLVHRCSQQVTVMSYKSHDVAFVKEDKCETVNISSITNEALYDGTPDSTLSSNAQIENI